MNVATNMHKTFELMNMHHAVWLKVQYDLELTQVERDDLYDAYTQATADAYQAIQQVRENEVLVLSSVVEAKAFLGMWSDLENNCGALRSVRIGNVSRDGKKLIRC
ncbi:hypothetical protein ACJRO7_006961 [Eucalyptus globulus]|uniref:Uncharacterized protein n=1 Tax=Eucalyptus globulus TaxID=34317 RepID=A0ABD3IJN2_EUCGL